MLLQDHLLYDEPPPWYCSEREQLASSLLSAGKAEEAEKVLNEDLVRNPNSGWALSLLEKSLRRAEQDYRGGCGWRKVQGGLAPSRL